MSNLIAPVPAHDEHADRVFLDMVASIIGNLNDGLVDHKPSVIATPSGNVGGINAGTLTPLTFDAASVNADGIWSSGAPTRFTFATAGFYKLNLGLVWLTDAGTGDLREVSIRKNGTTIIARDSNPPTAGTSTTWVEVSTVDHFNAGDYIEFCALQDNTASIMTVEKDAEYSLYARIVRA